MTIVGGEERARRAREVLAEALCLLDSFAGDGLCHTYGNGQTIDAAGVCSELAEAFDLPCEPGWWRKLPELLTFADEGSGIGELREALQEAHNAIEQALDDMGADGHCVCPDAKEWLKTALAKSDAALSQSS